jgi:hypothetical protein
MEGLFVSILFSWNIWVMFLALVGLTWLAFRFAPQWRAWMPLFVGMVVLAGLFVPTDLLAADGAYPNRGWLMDAVKFAVFFLPGLGLLIAGVLFTIGLNIRREKTTTGRGYLAACALLGFAILARILYSIYWLIVWDGTGDSLDFLWIAFPVMCACAIAIGLIIALPGRRKWAGIAYLVCVPASIILVYIAADRVDFRELTSQRAGRVKDAVEAYHQSQGVYPTSLQQLPAWQRLTLAGPVILYGQEWCYQGGQDYYRLGYLDRDHWSSPIIYGRVYTARGLAPIKGDICQPAIDAYRAQYPGWDRALEEYGRPTPTPDSGT